MNVNAKDEHMSFENTFESFSGIVRHDTLRQIVSQVQPLLTEKSDRRRRYKSSPVEILIGTLNEIEDFLLGCTSE